MHVRHPSGSAEQRTNVAPGLGRLQPAERGCHLGDLDILRRVSRHDEEQAGVRSALVELARGVEVAGAEAEGRCASERARPGGADGLETRGYFRRRRQVSEEGEVVTRAGGPPQLRWR